MRRLLNKRLIPENIIIISGFHWVLTLTFGHISKRPVWHVSAVENGQVPEGVVKLVESEPGRRNQNWQLAWVGYA
jgi:hypothetical protein